MEISWLGHSCFRIRGNRTTVVTDPFAPTLGYTLGKPTAKIVTISHNHEGHAYFEGVAGEPRKIDRPGEYETNGVFVLGVPTFHDDEKGSLRGKNTVYALEIDEICVCHLGDLGHALTDTQAGEIGNVDVLLLPVGGMTTIDATIAAKLVRQLEPKVVLPMHYQTPAFKGTLEPVDRFLKEVGAKEITPQPKLSFTKATLPVTTQVFLLDCAA